MTFLLLKNSKNNNYLFETNLSEYLFDEINGIDLISRDKRLEAEEIDLIFKNVYFFLS